MIKENIEKYGVWILIPIHNYEFFKGKKIEENLIKIFTYENWRKSHKNIYLQKDGVFF